VPYWCPNLAPPVATLAHRQSVFLANHSLSYSSLIQSSLYVDTSFATKAG
jgi:hypothetical protein